MPSKPRDGQRGSRPASDTGKAAMASEAIDGTRSSRRGIGNGALGRTDTEHERPAAAEASTSTRPGLAAAGVGGAHSTVEAGESRRREGALVLERFRRRGDQGDWET